MVRITHQEHTHRKRLAQIENESNNLYNQQTVLKQYIQIRNVQKQGYLLFYYYIIVIFGKLYVYFSICLTFRMTAYLQTPLLFPIPVQSYT